MIKFWVCAFIFMQFWVICFNFVYFGPFLAVLLVQFCHLFVGIVGFWFSFPFGCRENRGKWKKRGQIGKAGFEGAMKIYNCKFQVLFLLSCTVWEIKWDVEWHVEIKWDGEWHVHGLICFLDAQTFQFYQIVSQQFNNSCVTKQLMTFFLMFFFFWGLLVIQIVKMLVCIKFSIASHGLTCLHNITLWNFHVRR